MAEREFEALKERIAGKRLGFKRVSCINATLPLSQISSISEDLSTACKVLYPCLVWCKVLILTCVGHIRLIPFTICSLCMCISDVPVSIAHLVAFSVCHSEITWYCWHIQCLNLFLFLLLFDVIVYSLLSYRNCYMMQVSTHFLIFVDFTLWRRSGSCCVPGSQPGY